LLKRALRFSIAAGAALAVAIPAAQSAAPMSPVAPATSAGQLWYHLELSVSGSYRLRWANGDTQVQENAWSLNSNTAILLKRVCVVPGGPLSPAVIATAAGLGSNWSCAELRRKFPHPDAETRQFLSRLREDFSVSANAGGSAGKWKATTVEIAHTSIINGRTARCPGGQRQRELSAPVDIVGSIGGSARNGISVGFDIRGGKWASGRETRSYDECKDAKGDAVTASDHTSREVLLSAAVLAGAYAPVYGSESGGGEFGGALTLNAVKVGNAEHLFGRDFTLSGVQPATHEFSDSASSSKSVHYRIHFVLCPRGGRDVQHC
jgi:hypothetical protein